jgi:ribonuclease P protein component
LIGRIRQREVFSRLSKEGTYVRSSGLWCSMMIDPTLSSPHIGYAIGRSVGGAVQRNRVKRQLRALFAAREAQLEPGWYLVGVQRSLAGASFEGLSQAVDALLGKVTQKP